MITSEKQEMRSAISFTTINLLTSLAVGAVVTIKKVHLTRSEQSEHVKDTEKVAGTGLQSQITTRATER